MVSHAVWKTWPSGLSYDKNLGLRPRFLSTESLGPCFSHGMGDHDQILQYWLMRFSHQACIGEPTKHTRGCKGLKHFALFEFIKLFANDHPCHYIIHTQHDCPSQMNLNLMISVYQINSLSLVNLLLVIIKMSFTCEGQQFRDRKHFDEDRRWKRQYCY